MCWPPARPIRPRAAAAARSAAARSARAGAGPDPRAGHPGLKAAVTYGNHIPHLKVATVVGGVPYGAQLAALRGPVDLLIATPGRLIDHLDSGKAILGQVEMLILDADRMLDMGFIEDIERIAESLPAGRPDRDGQRDLRRSGRSPGRPDPEGRCPAHRGRQPHRQPRQHRAATAVGR